MIFGTDWTGVPGIEANALLLMDLGLGRETVELILHRNAERVHRLHRSRGAGLQSFKTERSSLLRRAGSARM